MRQVVSIGWRPSSCGVAKRSANDKLRDIETEREKCMNTATCVYPLLHLSLRLEPYQETTHRCFVLCMTSAQCQHIFVPCPPPSLHRTASAHFHKYVCVCARKLVVNAIVKAAKHTNERTSGHRTSGCQLPRPAESHQPRNGTAYPMQVEMAAAASASAANGSGAILKSTHIIEK